jgi:hypothetical protein
MWRFDGLIKQRAAAGQQATGAGSLAATTAGGQVCGG